MENRGARQVVTVMDNLDLGNQRKRLGLSQQDIADLLCGFEAGSGKGFNFSNVSRFETGSADSMPPRKRGERRLTRDDYEALLKRLAKKAVK